MYAYAHAHARTHACAHTQTRTRAGAVQPDECRSTHARAHRHAHKHTRSLAGSQMRTHMCACGCVRTCTHPDITHVPALAQKRTHAQKITHARALAHKRTFPRCPLTRADGARCVVWVSAFRRRWTSLHHAAHGDAAAVVAALLKHGADVHAKDKNGCGGRSPCWGDGRRAPGRGRPGRDRRSADRDAPRTHTDAPRTHAQAQYHP